MYLRDCLAALEVFGPKLSQVYGQGESPMTITGLSKRDHADTNYPRISSGSDPVGTARSVVEVAVGEVGRSCRPARSARSWYEATLSWPAIGATPATATRLPAGGWLYRRRWVVRSRRLPRRSVIVRRIRRYGWQQRLSEGGRGSPAAGARRTESPWSDGPDPEWGETIVAFVVAPSGRRPRSELDAACLAALGPLQAAPASTVRSALPKNSYGQGPQGNCVQVFSLMTIPEVSRFHREPESANIGRPTRLGWSGTDAPRQFVAQRRKVGRKRP